MTIQEHVLSGNEIVIPEIFRSKNIVITISHGLRNIVIFEADQYDHYITSHIERWKEERLDRWKEYAAEEIRRYEEKKRLVEFRSAKQKKMAVSDKLISLIGKGGDKYILAAPKTSEGKALFAGEHTVDYKVYLLLKEKGIGDGIYKIDEWGRDGTKVSFFSRLTVAGELKYVEGHIVLSPGTAGSSFIELSSEEYCSYEASNSTSSTKNFIRDLEYLWNKAFEKLTKKHIIGEFEPEDDDEPLFYNRFIVQKVEGVIK